MRKRGIALAVGALFAAPGAFAQELGSSVQIYGKLYPQFAVANTRGATAVGSSVSTLTSVNGILPAGNGNSGSPNGANHASRNSVDTQNSYIGFRGTEQLAPGMKVIWQIEQALNFDVGDQFWANRNSFLGLDTRFGTVKLGNMDTIYKEFGDTFGMFGISSGNFVSASNVLSHVGFGNNRAARFHERKPNSVQYWTPPIAGLQAAVQYSPDENKGNPGITRNADWWSMGIKYDMEPFYLSLHHEIHNDTFGGSSNTVAALSNVGDPNARSKDTATRVTAEYKFGGIHRLAGDFAMLKYKESGQTLAAPRFQEYKHNTWQIGWEARWGGPWRTALQYVGAGAGKCELTGGLGCSTEGLEGKMFSAGVAYSLSRRTFIYVIGTKLINGHSAVYDNAANFSPSVGADINQVALGISHNL
jgi:predicted porin